MIRAIWVWLARIVLLSITLTLLAATLAGFWSSYQQTMFWYSDKIAHYLSMLFLTTAALLALPKVRARAIFAISVAIAAFIELVQLFGPRTADYGDFGSSLAGIITVAAVFYSALFRRWQLEDGYGKNSEENTQL